MGKLGTVTWLTRTGGRLAWHDKLALMAQGVQARVASRQGGLPRTRLRWREVSEILPPDSAVSREAVALAQDCSPPYLFNHCMRAYFWARLLDDDRRPFDDEAVFVALMLHDLGLTERMRVQGLAAACFTAVGARVAQELTSRHQWSEARTSLTANAISLHLNVIVGAAHGKEAQMVRAGSGGDVAGLGLGALAPGQIRQVVERFPRLHLKSEIVNMLLTEAREQPCCRTAFLCRSLGFTALIQGNRIFAE